MSATTFLVMYLIGGLFSWVAWIILFFISRGASFFINKSAFFTDFLGGSCVAIFGWPFAILYFAYNTIFGKSIV
jgi:hypothetical protein